MVLRGKKSAPCNKRPRKNCSWGRWKNRNRIRTSGFNGNWRSSLRLSGRYYKISKTSIDKSMGFNRGQGRDSNKYWCISRAIRWWNALMLIRRHRRNVIISSSGRYLIKIDWENDNKEGNNNSRCFINNHPIK